MLALNELREALLPLAVVLRRSLVLLLPLHSAFLVHRATSAGIRRGIGGAGPRPGVNVQVLSLAGQVQRCGIVV